MLKKPTRLILLISLILLVAVVSGNAITPKKATFVLKNGVQYKDVVFKTNKQLQIIKIEQDGKKINISFHDIETILDKYNEDITNTIISRSQSRNNETWRSGEDQVYKKAFKKLWNSALGFNLNYSMPTGFYYTGIDPGIGYGGDFLIPLTHNAALKFSFSRSGIKAPNDLDLFGSLDPNITITGQEIDIRTLRFLISGVYYHRPDRITPGKSIYYFYSGLGAVSEKTTTSLSIYNNSTGQSYTGFDSFSETYFDLTFGGGIIQLISDKVGIDVGLSLDMITIASNGNSSQYAYIIDMKLGIVTLF